jgi:hypothetical protein
VTGASAKKAKPAAWAKKHRLTGAWKTKDADRDGVKNLAEFKLGTDPRRADSDRDGLKDGDELKSGNDPLDPDTDGDRIKDGAEHAGVVTRFDGETITIRQFKGGLLKATLAEDAACGSSADADDSSADDENYDDEDWSDDDDDFLARAASFGDDEDDGDFGEDEYADDSAYEDCDTDAIEPGTVLQSTEIERSGGRTFVVALVFAD